MGKDYQIPFDEKGDMMDYSNGWRSATEWRDRIPFDAVLTYDAYSRGRSAFTTWWKDERGVRYPMFASGLDDVLNSGLLVGKTISAEWIAKKKGENYGIELHKG